MNPMDGASAVQAALPTMTVGGWIFMGSAWALILGLNIFCFRGIMRERVEEIVDPVPEAMDRDHPAHPQE